MTEIAPAPKPKRERPHLGYSATKGKIRYSSVSQIVIYDPRQEGGCNRRWAFIYVFGKKEAKSDAQLAGNKHAESLEEYLTTGVDTLTRELRAAKHFFPRPGPDLEVEQPLGDMALAVNRRDAMLRGEGDPAVLAAEVRRAAGLVAAGVPLDGAADYRHRRGEYLDEAGVLRDEEPGVIACEIGDLKTTSRIRNHQSRPTPQNPRGVLYEGRAKTVEQMLWHPQNLGYGVHAAERYPELTHVRPSLVYAQTKHGLDALKRTALLTVGEVQHRWATTVEPLMREMMDVAAHARRPEDVPVNLGSCKQFGKDCPHADYCDRPNQTIVDLLAPRSVLVAPRIEGGARMAGLFDPIPAGGVPPVPVAPPVAAPAVLGLFSPTAPAAPVASSPPVAPPLTGADREAAIATHREKLLAEDAVGGVVPTAPVVYGACVACGIALTPANAYSDTGRIVHYNCAGVAPTPLPLGIGAVNPPDAPPPDWRASATPVPPDVMGTIPDPEVAALTAAHAAAVAAQQAAAEEGKPKAEKKTGGRCAGGGQRVTLTTEEASGKTTKRICHVCGKKLSIKPSADKTEATLPPHNVLKPEEPTAPQAPPPLPPGVPPIPQAPPPLPPGVPPMPPIPQPPPLPFGVPAIPPFPLPPPPPLPPGVPPVPTEYRAPNALPGQTGMPQLTAPPPLPAQVRLPALPAAALETPGAAIVGLGTAVYIFLDPRFPPPPGVYCIGADGTVARIDAVVVPR